MPRRKPIEPKVRDALNREIRELLIACAEHQPPTITYMLLASQVRTYPLAAQSAALREALIDISAQENAAGRGMLSAVVVRSGRNRPPGKGFFTQAAELGRDISSRRAAWMAELKTVCDYWRNH